MHTSIAAPAPATGRGATQPTHLAPVVGERLRRLRVDQNLTLHDVQARTAGEFKASALGAYERGDRTLSVSKLARLAELYGVDVSLLVAADEVIDLPGLHADEGSATPSTTSDFEFGALARFSAYVRTRRREPSMTPITLRATDLEYLGVVLGHNGAEIDEMLAPLGLRAPDSRPRTVVVAS